MDHERPSLLPNDWIEEDEFCRELNCSLRTARRWHEKQKGPPRIVLPGRRRGYRRSDVRRWLEELADKSRGGRNRS